MNEIWKTYTKNTGRGKRKHTIEVSNLGNVKVDGKLIDLSNYHPTKYLMIYGIYVHRMIAELFIPNPENKPQVDHINTNRLDNRAENLRWVTQSENMLNPITRKHTSEASKRWERKPISEETKKKISKGMKEYNNEHQYICRIKGKKLMTDGIDRIFVEPEYWGEFLDIGFWFVCEKHHKLLY